jgi:predicted MFS family arabinose efflux permease
LSGSTWNKCSLLHCTNPSPCDNARAFSRPLISFARYAALLAASDVRQTFLASFIGRLPIGIAGLSILLLVQSTSGSFARGGLATACYVAGLAAVAPILGRLIDHRGPHATLLACAALYPAALIALVAAVARETPLWLVPALATMAGATFPPITVCMRAYLKQRLASHAQLTTAYSLESVLIEMVFILGPMSVALFIAFASPAIAVLSAAACGSAGTLLFLRSPALRQWRTESRASRSLLGALAAPGFPTLVAVIACYASAFGLLEIGITAYATESGQPALAGVLLGLMSAGSAIGGLAYGSRAWHAPLVRQLAVTLALTAVGLALLAFRWSAWSFALWCIVAGVVMAPALIIQSMLVAKSASPQHTTEAFTWSTSALLSGIGLGFVAGGALLERFSSSSVFAVAALAALLAALGARVALRRL